MTTVPTIGKGYRQLAPDELVKKGDEYWVGLWNEWVPAHNWRSCWKGQQTEGSIYRRKLKKHELTNASTKEA